MPELTPRYVLRYRYPDGKEWEGTGRTWDEALAAVRMRRVWGFSPPIGVRRAA